MYLCICICLFNHLFMYVYVCICACVSVCTCLYKTPLGCGGQQRISGTLLQHSSPKMLRQSSSETKAWVFLARLESLQAPMILLFCSSNSWGCYVSQEQLPILKFVCNDVSIVQSTRNYLLNHLHSQKTTLILNNFYLCSFYYCEKSFSLMEKSSTKM